jgi:voltage-gated potassium channel
LEILSCSISDGEWADVPEDQEKMKLKEKIFNIIQIGDKSNPISRMFDIFITVTIVANILVTFLQTFDELAFLTTVFKGVEYVTIFIFCVEYILRIWTAEYLYPDKSRGRSRLRFLVSFDGIVDFLTIVPVFFLSGFVIFRMLRVARIFHLFRLNAKYDSFNVITTVLYEKRNQIISSVFIVLILMLASSLCMYSVEHDAQPTVFRNAFSGIWWSMSTLLTVGYGDIYPITPLGRVMAICIAYLGVGAVAIPTGIISAGFVEQYQRKSNISGLKNEDIKEIAEVFVDKKYAGKTVQDMEEANQLTVFLILREDFSILPQKDTILRMNDIIVIRDENENS